MTDMEVFVDLGMFELLVGLGLAAASRAVFRRRWLAALFLAWTALAPATLLFVARDEVIRWLAVGCLVPALVNVATLAMLLKRHDLGRLLNERPAALQTRLGG
jgi:peptidoglycan/LPS O-acetylase OafA/YrhL